MSAFGLTPDLIEMVKKEEGWVDHPYKDVAGLPTIGWGHRIPTMDHPTITPAEGMEILDRDLAVHRAAALRLSPGLADEPERRLAAITDFCYNLGADNYAQSTLRTCVNKKDWVEAGKQMRRWVYATDAKTGEKIKLAGLIRRRDTTARWLEAV